MVTQARMESRLRAVIRGVAVATLIIVAMMAWGWFARHPAAVKVRNMFFAVPQNTAIALALASVGLLLTPGKKRRTVAACGTAAALIGLITLFEHIFQLGPAFDQLLFTHPPPAEFPSPGRMPPHAAISFILLGAGLIIDVYPLRFTQRPVTLVLLGAAVSAIGLVALTAFFRGHQTDGWDLIKGLSFGSSLSFALLGMGVSCCGWTIRREEELDVHQLRTALLLYTGIGMVIMVTVSALLAMLASHEPGEFEQGIGRPMSVILITALGLALLGAVGMYLLVQPLANSIVVRTGTLEKQVRDATGALQSELQEFKRLDAALASQAGRLDRANAELKASREQLAAQARELERLNQELNRSNQELAQFAYAASHDLQEPLRMVASYMQLLEKRYKDKLDPEAGEFIGFAVDGAKRMQILINDLLAYSRVSTQGEAFVQTDAGAALDQALANLQTRAKDTGAAITRGPMPTLRADPGQLTRLLQNLLSNAMKFCKERQPQINVSARREGDAWLFSIRDNGIGIDPSHADRLFNIFQRLHHRDEYEGTGIGLAVCKRIVERHGGRIWFDSTPGEGTTFHFTIADSTEPQANLTPTSPSDAAAAARTTP